MVSTPPFAHSPFAYTAGHSLSQYCSKLFFFNIGAIIFLSTAIILNMVVGYYFSLYYNGLFFFQYCNGYFFFNIETGYCFHQYRIEIFFSIL